MPPRRSSDIFVPVNNIGTSTNRNVITPEMREAYHNTLLEKEKIIEEIALVKEELRQGGIDMENLHLREQEVKRSAQEPAVKYNPSRIHPGTVPSPTKRSAHVAGPSNAAPSPRPMPPPMPAKQKTTQVVQTTPSPPPPLPPRSTSPPAPPPPIPPRLMTPPAPPPPSPPKHAHLAKEEEEQAQPETKHQPMAKGVDNETTQTDQMSRGVVIPENLRISDNHRPKQVSGVPPTPPSTRVHSLEAEAEAEHAVHSPAKEVEEYLDFSDTSLAIQRDLHMEIAAMHAAIQKRLMLGGAFIILLIFLLIFY